MRGKLQMSIGFRGAPTARVSSWSAFPGLGPPHHPSDEDLSLGTPAQRTSPWAIFGFSLRENRRALLGSDAPQVSYLRPGRPADRATNFPCPILVTFFGRKGGKPRISIGPATIVLGALLWCLTSIQAFAQAPAPAAPVVLDRVVAVVNNQAILGSDIDHEIRLSVLDPGRGGLGVLTPTRALDQLIGRALIQQQIRQEDQQAADPPQAEVNARLGEIRRELPACVRQNCSSDAGWKAFLAAHTLTEDGVETYLRYRLEILRFIEQRFRQGISISPEEIATYYHDTLLPQYAKGEAIPTLDKVSARIQEILLQQRVNGLFDDWLNNLRKQGDVEVLDPTLEAPSHESPAAPGSQPDALPGTLPGDDEGIE